LQTVTFDLATIKAGEAKFNINYINILMGLMKDTERCAS